MKKMFFILVALVLSITVTTVYAQGLVTQHAKVETNTIKTLDGTVSEETETFFDTVETPPNLPPQSDNIITTVERISTDEGIITVVVDTVNPDQSIPLDQPVDGSSEGGESTIENNILASTSTFIDHCNCTCPNGAQFKYSTTSGGSQYTLQWQGGSFSNTKSCGGSSCNFTITTSWQATYTSAYATVTSPTQVWGPFSAYTCK